MSLTPTVLTDAVIIIDGNTISDHANKVELPITAEALETTAFGATYKSRVGGLKDGMVNITLFNDFSASQLDSIMWPLIGLVKTFAVRTTSASTSSTNPAYTGSLLITGWTPLSGSVGQLVAVDMSYPTSGSVSRVTS